MAGCTTLDDYYYLKYFIVIDSSPENSNNVSAKSSIRVVLSANTAWYLYNFRSGLIKAMIYKGWCVAVIAPEDRYFHNLREIGCVTYDISMDNKGSNPINDSRTVYSYWNLLRYLKPDIALWFTVKPVVYGTFVSKLLGIVSVTTITGLGTAFIHHTNVTRLVKILYRLTQRWAVAILFQNRNDLDELVRLRLVPESKSAQVPGSGIDLDHFKLVAIPAGETKNYLLLGRLLWDKGIAEYVAAARKVKSIYPSTRFQILGPTGVENRTAVSRRQLEDWEDEGIIDYLGEVDDVRKYIAQAHCVVLPSYREGLSRALLEGAAIGRPLVATDVSGCREVIEDNENGYLCAVGDSEDLARKLVRVYLLTQQEITEMGRKSRKKVECEFDENLVINRYINLIEDSVEKSQ